MSAVIETLPRPAGRCALGAGTPGRVIAHAGGRDIALHTFHAQVRALAARLPAGTHAVNLCEDRYRFMVALCAVALRGQVTLLPPSRAPAVVDEVMARQPATYALGDQALAVAPPHYWRLPEVLDEADGPVPEVDEDAVFAVAFTSGSTGAPKAFPRRWRSSAPAPRSWSRRWPTCGTARGRASSPPCRPSTCSAWSSR